MRPRLVLKSLLSLVALNISRRPAQITGNAFYSTI